MKIVIGFISGLLFGIGLIISGMTDPQLVIAFLDFDGAWNPALIFVMLGALMVAFMVFRLSVRLHRDANILIYA